MFILFPHHIKWMLLSYKQPKLYFETAAGGCEIKGKVSKCVVCLQLDWLNCAFNWLKSKRYSQIVISSLGETLIKSEGLEWDRCVSVRAVFQGPHNFRSPGFMQQAVTLCLCLLE